ncbi:Pleckstrin-like proteiny domain-containing family A member 5, partial [Zootermopsis nevadensis]
GQQQLRSPVVKRPSAARVALQGWLHKQGSEGLMLWKKRWFVLSEYCLFYYKGPEEEKLLGSILLPSYKISPCSPEDRVYRKFAFKAEHTNMRTYHFAADTRELMVQWMNALSLASILQEGSSWNDHRSGHPSVSSISSLLNQSADDSDSGFHGYQQPQSVTTGTPSTVPASSASKLGDEQAAKKEDAAHQLNTSHDSVFSNGWGVQKNGAGFHQPLYANAPPKPRRLAEHEDYGASSPEPSSDRWAEESAGKKTPDGNKGFLARIAQPQQPMRNEYGFMDVRYHYHQVDGQTPVHSSQRSPQQEQLQRLPQQSSGSHAQLMTNVERRTPDTYGRSNSTTPGPTGPTIAVGLKGGDYEDVYNATDAMRHSGSEGSYGEVYRKSSSQVAYIKGAGSVISVHHKQENLERARGDNYHPPQGGGQYGHSGHQQQNYVAHRYASAVSSQHPDARAPDTYPATTQQQPPLPPQHQDQSVRTVRRRDARPSQYPPRPHSADFLDYDAKRSNQHYACQSQYHGQEAARSRDYLQHGCGDGRICQEEHARRVAQLPRPKSSLEMVPAHDPSVSDNYYWSEEHYAQKMRQSASYVHQISPVMHVRNQSSSSRATTPSIRISTPSGLINVDGGMKGGAQVRGVSSGGSVNSESAGVVLRHPKRTELKPSDAATAQSPSRQHYQQRRWSEYRDPCSDGQFTRSASARLPRQRYQDDEIDSQCEEQQRKCTLDACEGEKKLQQREESMKRLLEWKQRMLQSPLTRKPSGSSARGTAQNELSKYYKQQVLQELASREARSRDLTSGQDGRVGSKRRSQLDDTGTVPGRSALRSRSQDGRRSSTSVSRYNSYSSDDEGK